MLNQIIAVRKNMEGWGFNVPNAAHPNLSRNKLVKKDKDPPIKIVLGKELVTGSRIVSIETSTDPNTFTYGNGNMVRAFTLLFPNNHGFNSKFTAKFGRFVATHNELVERLTELPPLENLTNYLKSLDLLEFVTQVQGFLNQRQISTSDGTTSMIFEVEDDEKVHTMEFMEKISAALYVADRALEGSETDVFGNPRSGSDAPFNPIATSWKKLKVFSKNIDNKCYRRFEMNSVASCPIGNRSRSIISDTLRFLITEENRNKIWYSYSASKNPMLVLTTLCPPGINLLELDESEESENQEIWEAKINSVIQSMRVMESLDPHLQGELLVIQVIMSGIVNVGCHVEASRTLSIPEIITCVESWKVGIMNGVQTKRSGPSIAKLLRLLAKRPVVKNQRLTFVDDNTGLKLMEGYDFFFDDVVVAKKFLRIYAAKFVPALLSLFRYKYSGEMIADYVNIGNLILHKLGYHFKENTVEHWAFYMGRLFNQVDWADKLFFEKRGLPVPPHTCGRLFVNQAYRAPQAAVGAMLTKFNVRLVYMLENAPGVLAGVREAHAKMMDLCGGNIPKIATDTDRAMLAAGYLMYQQKKEVPSETVNS